MKKFSFKSACPVWEKGKEKERNYALVFKAKTGQENVVINIAASSSYQLFVNDKFVASGPARAAHSCYRADVIELSRELTKTENEIKIIVVGYNTTCYGALNQPSFLCAEIISADKVLAATGVSGFTAYEYTEKVQRIQRYSAQRPFSEYYRLGDEICREVTLCRTENKDFYEREAYYPEYDNSYITRIVNEGVITKTTSNLRPFEDRSVAEIGTACDGFERDELEFEVTDYLGRLQFDVISKNEYESDIVEVKNNTFKTLSCDINNTGFVAFDVECNDDTRVVITFDEMLTGDFVDYTRNASAAALTHDLKKGSYRVVSFEPYTLKYLSIIADGADIKISNLKIIEYKFPSIDIEYKSENKKLNGIFTAAVETFRQNAVDFYTDCPSRERGGYLCDSFFTARAEHALTGKTVIERCFLDNYINYNKQCPIPDDMIPMCYPADFFVHKFIPNWAMWFVLELEEYMSRSGDKKFIEDAKGKVYGLLRYFKGFENEYTLLEKLESWIFVEWSDSNKYVQDVNFPTNMLYYRMKRAAAAMYNDEELNVEADILKKAINELSYKDGFFRDRAMRRDGKLFVTDEITETAQYYAFFMDTATPDAYPELWERIVNDFGPKRKEKYSYVSPSNAFIGNYLRLDLLSRYGLKEQLLSEMEDYFGYMADLSGTLWEYDDCRVGSLCHGFASHAAVWLLED